MQYIARFEDNTYSATLSESFTFRDNAGFREMLDDITSKPVSDIVLELSGVDFVDSAALGMLLLLRDMAEKKHAQIILEGASGQVARMFEISKFAQLFTVK